MNSQVIGSGAERERAESVSAPVRLGAVPALADNFYARSDTGLHLASGPVPGEILVLTDAVPAQSRDRAVGLGKTQLAAWLGNGLMRNRTVDLLVWINASSRDSVLTGYAEAFAELGVDDMPESLDSAVRGLLEWLAAGSRPWLVVLDDLADYRDLEGLWPPGPARRVLVTTRVQAPPSGLSGRLVRVGSFSRREAVNYLVAALKHDPDLGLS